MVSLPEHALALHQSRPAKRAREVNVGDAERLLSVLGGAALALMAARRRGAAGAALALVGGTLLHRGTTGRCVVYGALGLDTSDGEHGMLERRHGPAAVLDAAKATRVERSVTIQRDAGELYAFWRRLDNLPRVMRHLDRVTELSPTRSRWRAKAPAGQRVEWEAEIINDIPGELISWRSVEEATVPNAGSVHFTPATGGRGTVVRVVLEYEPPVGPLGALAARVVHEEPDTQVREDLRRFKRMMEAGEAPTTEGQPSCRE
jgi:uncharacterized membrane protein